MAQVQDEDHFDTNDGGTPRVSDVNTYVSVLAVDRYRFMDHAYYGTNGFRDGTYLIPHDREMFYKKRKDFSVYKNFVRPIINALVDPVFAEEAPRAIISNGSETSGAPIARDFLGDVDGAGTAMQDYMYQVSSRARLHGVNFTLIDNYSVDDMAPTVQGAIDVRAYPYCVTKNAYDVVLAKTDDLGRMTEIWFSEPRGDNTERARKWTAEYSVIMERNLSEQDNAWHEAGDYVYHNLGVIPVVPMYTAARTSVHEVLPDPPMYDIARLNHLIYNKDSEIRDLERSQAFSILYLQSDIGGNVTLGSHNAILIPQGSSITPGYISPDSANLVALVDNNKYYMEDLFRSAEQSGVHAVQTSQAASGVALAWKFWGVDHQLRQTARIATTGEEWIMYILSLYTGEQYEYRVDYPTTYQPGDRMQEITGLKEIVDMQPPKALKKIVFEKIAKLLMSDDTVDEQRVVLEEIGAELGKQEGEQEGEQEGGPNP